MSSERSRVAEWASFLTLSILHPCGFHRDATVRVWDSDSKVCSASLAGGKGDPLDCIRFHPCVPHLLGVSSSRSSAVVWDVSAGKEMAMLELQSRASTFEWSPDGRLLCALCEDGCVRGMDPRDGGGK